MAGWGALAGADQTGRDTGAMLIELLAQALSPGERIEALHGHFSTRSTWDSFQVVYATAIIAVVLCAALLLLSRIQRARAQREERARDQRRRARTARPEPQTQVSRNLTLIQKRQAERQADARTSPAGLRR